MSCACVNLAGKSLCFFRLDHMPTCFDEASTSPYCHIDTQPHHNKTTANLANALDLTVAKPRARPAVMDTTENTGMASPSALTTPTDGTNAAPQDHLTLAGDKSQTLDKAELLRQVEHYFSDENLQTDAHLLGKLQEGNGTVSIAQITGWPRMRKYRPMSAVKEALKDSTIIEVINNKRLRRRDPFDMAKAKVTPRIAEEERKVHQTAVLSANPHLSKAMLKRTGFEHDHVESALTAEERQTELEQYSTELPIYERLETAVLRYTMNRKLHQETMSFFHAFLNYGGFHQRPLGFTGGTSKEEEEGLSKEEKASRKQDNFVSDEAKQSISEGDGKWIVDFEGVTKGFFSTPFSMQFLWHDDLEHDKRVTQAACNVLRNFFNYLIYHNVCAEYADQIIAARDALKLIESEYVKLAQVQMDFPGAFNIACSTLSGGYYSTVGYRGDWMEEEEAAKMKKGYSHCEANAIAKAGISAFGTENHIDAMLKDSTVRVAKAEEDVGLEVTKITLPKETSPPIQGFFDKLKGTIVAPMGKLLCKRIQFEKAAPLDLPPDLPAGPQTFTFLVDQDTLQKCFLGMKLIATVKKTTSGFWFIDHWSECHGTFYTWCWNERAREYKEYTDPFELAKPKYRAGAEHEVRMGEDRMLEDGGHVEELAMGDEPGESVDEQKSQAQKGCSSERANSDDCTIKGDESKVEEKKREGSGESYVVVQSLNGMDSSSHETSEDSGHVGEFTSLVDGSGVSEDYKDECSEDDGGFFSDEENAEYEDERVDLE
jgi:hypothetical protein